LVPFNGKNGKILDVWKGGTLSIAGTATLINSSPTSTYIYHMSMYLLPKTVVKQLDKQRRTFFWQGGGHKKKYYLLRWEIICKSKKKGGLGIKSIEKMNLSLLCKWWWRLDVKNKVVGNVSHRLGDSPIWTDLLKVKH
jgi:hypothetical protein